MTWEVRQGHVLDLLRAMPENSVQCVMTSPPYWGLRSYKTESQVWGGNPECIHDWRKYISKGQSGGPSEKQSSNTGSWHDGGACGACGACGAWRGELGLEPTPELFVQHIVEVFREVKRVLRKDGTLWMNLGDSYATTPRGTFVEGERNVTLEGGSFRANKPFSTIGNGLKPKDLCGIPWRVAFALQADGWWLRSDIIWAKPNPMPESVTDRPTKAHEYLFLLTKSATYFFDQEAVREPHKWADDPRNDGQRHTYSDDAKHNQADPDRQRTKTDCVSFHPNGRNLRTVWTIPTQAYSEAHFATFPEKLVEPCIRAGTGESGACAECGMPLRRIIEPTVEYARVLAERKESSRRRNDDPAYFGTTRGTSNPSVTATHETIGWTLNCNCGVCDVRPCTVLDPFCGSGTVGVVALKLGRSFLGLELQPTYCEMAKRRIGEVMPLFADIPS